MENFTPISALVGGALIGLAATLLMALNGRIAGVSGILGGLVSPDGGARSDRFWRLMFVIGLVAGALIFRLAGGDLSPYRIDATLPWIIVSGFIVGFSTRVGSGCTSGHGICGIGRLSMRSLVATVLFLGTAMVTTYVIRHVLGGF
ncbi:MAG: YeeE/YedE family protein [Alphaproteobacteria bacterium]